MKDLLLEQDLRDSGPDSNARAVASVQTSLILDRVDARRKTAVLRLLTDSHLIDADTPLIETSTLALQGADARGMDLSDTDLSRANLEDAMMEGANLSESDLSESNLREADLAGAFLSRADLNGSLTGGADLSEADLTDIMGWTEEQLRAAKSLEGATMPDGQTLKSADNPDGPTLEDWLREHE